MILGSVRYSTVDANVSTQMVKSTLFPNYLPMRVVGAYRVKKCQDPLVAPFIYPRWLGAQHMWPLKDEVPLYFCKQLHVKFYLGYDVDYTNYLSYVGHGKDQFRDKFKSPNLPQPPNKEGFGGSKPFSSSKRFRGIYMSRILCS